MGRSRNQIGRGFVMHFAFPTNGTLKNTQQGLQWQIYKGRGRLWVGRGLKKRDNMEKGFQLQRHPQSAIETLTNIPWNRYGYKIFKY